LNRDGGVLVILRITTHEEYITIHGRTDGEPCKIKLEINCQDRETIELEILPNQDNKVYPSFCVEGELDFSNLNLISLVELS